MNFSSAALKTGTACDPFKLYSGISGKGDPRDNLTIFPKCKSFTANKKTFPTAKNLSLTGPPW